MLKKPQEHAIFLQDMVISLALVHWRLKWKLVNLAILALFCGRQIQKYLDDLLFTNLQLCKYRYFNQKKEDRVPSYSGLKREVKKKKNLQFALQSTLTHILMRNNYVIKAFTLQSSLHFNCNKDFFLNTGLLRHL